MPKFIDLTGQTFGRLTIIKRAKNTTVKTRNAHWKCRCSCGNITIVQGRHLRSGHTKSCGCLSNELTKQRCTKHGLYGTPEYMTWARMLDRCYNPNHTEFKNYGGRGISVCNEWKNDFLAFYKDLGQRPSPIHSLDRIDNERGYSANNCRWATPKEQSNNTRKNHRITFYDWTMTISQWAKFVGLKPHIISQRLYYGWPPAKAIFQPVRKSK